jgi:hypothetical protein
MSDSRPQDEASAEIAEQIEILARSAPPVDRRDGPVQTTVSISFEAPNDPDLPAGDQQDDVFTVYWVRAAIEIGLVIASGVAGAIGGAITGGGDKSCTTKTTQTVTQSADGTTTTTTVTETTCTAT